MLCFSGQEETTVDFDDGVRITPFNMREEMEEGHFDKDGMYIFDNSKVRTLSSLLFCGFLLCPKCKHSGDNR